MRRMKIVRGLVTVTPIVIVGLSVGALLAQQSDTTRNPFAGEADAIAAGGRVFGQTCQTCHGPEGQGDRGPALNRGDLAHGNEDGDLFHSIRAGVPGTQMPAFSGISDEQTWQLVAYIRSLAPGNSPGLSATAGGDAAVGETLFFGKGQCSTCHEVNGRGGVVGPDLSTAGSFPAATLRNKILEPARPTPAGRGAAAPPQVVIATTKDGREIRGVRRNEDTFSVQVVDRTGRLQLLDKSALATYRVENTSLMPGDYRTRLSASELDQIVGYLGTLRARTPVTNSDLLERGGVSAER